MSIGSTILNVPDEVSQRMRTACRVTNSKRRVADARLNWSTSVEHAWDVAKSRKSSADSAMALGSGTVG